MKYLAFSILLFSALFFSISCQTTQNNGTAASTYPKAVNVSAHNKQLLSKEKAGNQPPSGAASWRAYWTQRMLKLSNDKGRDYAAQTLKSLDLERRRMGLNSLLPLNPALGGLHWNYVLN